MTLRIVTWNVERKKPTSPKGAPAVERLRSEQPDVAVLTEAWVGHLGDSGYEVTSHPTPLPGHHPDERKVVMWSKKPWTDVCDVGHPDMPAGRFVAGTTETMIEAVRVMGICIPWHMCDVTWGAKNATAWQRHLEWLTCFAELVAGRDRSIPLIVAGDFNQRVPRISSNVKAAAALKDALGDLTVVTAGTPAGLDGPAIDHIAVCPQFAAERVWGWPKDDGGTKMSDHSATAAELASAAGG
jgi:exonuclease III